MILYIQDKRLNKIRGVIVMKINNIEKSEKFTVGEEKPLVVEIKNKEVVLRFQGTQITFEGKLVEVSNNLKSFFEMIPTQNPSGFLEKAAEFLITDQKIENIILKSNYETSILEHELNILKNFKGEADFNTKNEIFRMEGQKILFENDDFQINAKITEITERKELYDINVKTFGSVNFEEIQNAIECLKKIII